MMIDQRFKWIRCPNGKNAKRVTSLVTVGELMHRFAIELSPERAELLIERLASWIVNHRLETPAIIFLESIKPLSFIGSQMWLMYGVPMLGIVIDEHQGSEYGLLFEDRRHVEALIRKIEALAREADEKKGKMRKTKND
ncbi:MAG: hypothetical protein JSV05_00330 [Candidatus Bathyarchaeota archaeon]|nr:MAG: hypothetical protein JSV05_00330 [Candidatus Bathyarchaeota archaeon]